MNMQNKKLIISLIIILMALAVLNIINSLFFKSPELESTSPSNRATSVELAAPIILTFSREVSASEIKLISSENESFVLHAEGRSIVAEHDKAFFNNRDYTIEIYYQEDLIHTLFFTTIRQESDPRVVQEIQDIVEKDYPLAPLTPHRTANYEVVYSEPLTFEIEILNSTLSQQEIVNVVRAWVSLQGLDPDSHTYNIKPSPVPTSYGVSN